MIQAHETGKMLHELMGWPGPMTHRQHVAWLEWWTSQQDVPNRGDWYLMQLDRTVKCLLAKDPDKIKLEHSKLKFGVPMPEKPAGPMSAEDLAMHKAMWIGLVGGPGKVEGFDWAEIGGKGKNEEVNPQPDVVVVQQKERERLGKSVDEQEQFRKDVERKHAEAIAKLRERQGGNP